jgi:uncharacterized protein (DUF58 family)
MAEIDRQRLPSYGRLELLAKQVVEGFITGLHKSPFHGFSVEFAEHRLYNAGESTRHIDWKLYARTEKLFVKRYEEETNLRCQLVIDTSGSMFYPANKDAPMNKLEFSVYAAASLIELLRRQRDAVGISLFSESTDVHTRAKSSMVHHKMLYHHLEGLLHSYKDADKRTTNAARALHEVADQLHRRSLVIIFSDMFDSAGDIDLLFGALQHLRHNKHEVVLFHVADKQHELDFEFGNRPYTFIDMETGDRIKLNPAQIKEQYQKQMAEFWRELKLKCGQYRVDLVEADIKNGFDQVLLQYLIKRQKMI